MSETRPSTPAMNELRVLIADAICEYMERQKSETIDTQDVTCALLQVAASCVIAMPGGVTKENIAWGLENFAIALGGISGTGVAFEYIKEGKGGE